LACTSSARSASASIDPVVERGQIEFGEGITRCRPWFGEPGRHQRTQQGVEVAEIAQCCDQVRGRNVWLERAERRAGVDQHAAEAEIGDARDPPLLLGDVGGEPVGIGLHEITHVDGDAQQRHAGAGRAGGEDVERGIVEAGELERHRNCCSSPGHR